MWWINSAVAPAWVQPVSVTDAFNGLGSVVALSDSTCCIKEGNQGLSSVCFVADKDAELAAGPQSPVQECVRSSQEDCPYRGFLEAFTWD